ncbi:putative Transmembrane protein [Cocos nucifera]|uniref:Putative Transmembrane protein n=1 Tax=Cocos nucifera TaxID=13894 RepID=A0A8K0II53_COCNU|nr:putative Transmembrane protein [Cocos nucifera]
MASSEWRRNLGNVRSFVGNAMGGLRGGSNLASWAVAGTLAYFLWVKPAGEPKKEKVAHFESVSNLDSTFAYLQTSWLCL